MFIYSAVLNQEVIHVWKAWDKNLTYFRYTSKKLRKITKNKLYSTYEIVFDLNSETVWSYFHVSNGRGALRTKNQTNPFEFITFYNDFL